MLLHRQGPLPAVDSAFLNILAFANYFVKPIYTQFINFHNSLRFSTRVFRHFLIKLRVFCFFMFYEETSCKGRKVVL